MNDPSKFDHAAIAEALKRHGLVPVSVVLALHETLEDEIHCNIVVQDPRGKIYASVSCTTDLDNESVAQVAAGMIKEKMKQGPPALSEILVTPEQRQGYRSV